VILFVCMWFCLSVKRGTGIVQSQSRYLAHQLYYVKRSKVKVTEIKSQNIAASCYRILEQPCSTVRLFQRDCSFHSLLSYTVTIEWPECSSSISIILPFTHILGGQWGRRYSWGHIPPQITICTHHCVYVRWRCRELSTQHRVRVHINFFLSSALNCVTNIAWYGAVHYDLLVNPVDTMTVIYRNPVRQALAPSALKLKPGFHSNTIACVACVVNENRKKRKRLRRQAANRGCHCFDRAFLLAGACVCCVKFSRNKLSRKIFSAIGIIRIKGGKIQKTWIHQ